MDLGAGRMRRRMHMDLIEIIACSPKFENWHRLAAVVAFDNHDLESVAILTGRADNYIFENPRLPVVNYCILYNIQIP